MKHQLVKIIDLRFAVWLDLPPFNSVEIHFQPFKWRRPYLRRGYGVQYVSGSNRFEYFGGLGPFTYSFYGRGDRS